MNLQESMMMLVAATKVLGRDARRASEVVA
jgi:hypothetical protein